jgi:hypothetical protein
MIENIKAVKNPLTIIAIFAGLAEICSTTVLPFIDKDIQQIFVWFIVIFPVLLVLLFFSVLNWNHTVLYAPTDYKNEDNFLKVKNKKIDENEIERGATTAANNAGRVKDAVSHLKNLNISNSQILSLQYASKWESPDFINYWDKLRSASINEIIFNPEISVISFSILNFLEEMAVSINKNLADEEMLKAIFKEIVINIWEKITFISDTQSEFVMQYSNLKKLYSKWKNA